LGDLSIAGSACGVAQWSTWSTCSEPCGGGVTSRTRTVTGTGCGTSTEEKGCNAQACTPEKPVGGPTGF
jgi:hypothetical protein